MGRGVLQVAIAFLLLTSMAHAELGDVFFVSKFSTATSPDGRSWDTAYRTIQEGIEAARRAFGGEVWVASAIYDEPRQEGGSLRLRPTVQLYGGFIGNEITRDQRNYNKNPTVIEASASNIGLPAQSVVVGANDALVDGFVIRGGRGPSGAGVLNISVNPTFANCVIGGNVAEDFGGGVINVDGATPRFINCTITGNLASGSGGGVANTNALPLFEGCVFSANISGEAGGAAFNTSESDAVYRRCRFERNEAVIGGGAIFNDGATPAFEECEFYLNTTPGFGGGIFNNSGADTLAVNCVFAKNFSGAGGGAISSLFSTMTAVNCTIADNTSDVDGSALFNNGSTTNVLNSIIWYNSDDWVFNLASATSIRWSNVGGGDGGPENIAIEPQFKNREDNDYSLLPTSPSIDAGTAEGAPPIDIRDVARPQGEGVDMGAYEIVNGEPEVPEESFDCFGLLGATGTPRAPRGDLLLLGCLCAGLLYARRMRGMRQAA